MNDLQYRWLFALMLLAILFTSSWLLSGSVRCWRRIERDALLFRLFAARDRLYVLIADGELSSESKWFTTLRDMVNAIIRESDDIGIHLYLNLAEKIFGDENVTPILDEERRELKEMSPAARMELRDTYVTTNAAIIDLLTFNSRITRFVRWAERNSDSLALGAKVKRESEIAVRRFDEIVGAAA